MNDTIAEMTPANIIPTSGTYIAFLNLILFNIIINIKAPKTLNAKANNNLKDSDNEPKNTNAINIPNCAESVIPTTEGDTNLFFDIVCMIKPAILIEVAVNIIASVLGKRELNTINHVSLFKPIKSFKLTPTTPMNNETIVNMMNATMSMIRLFKT